MGQDEGRRRLQSAIQIEGGDDRLADIGQECRPFPPPRPVLAGRQDDVTREVNPVGHARQSLAADENRVAARQVALVLVREVVEEKIGDDQAQHPVAKEFLAFAGILDAAVGRGRAGMN